jgi:hypothetical protein
MRKRRCEILLPLKHNDGRPVAGEAFEQTREELVSRFGAVTISPHTLLGIWTHEDERYEDELLKFVVDVADSAENEQFLADLKRVLLERFEQLEIYIASYPVDIL